MPRFNASTRNRWLLPTGLLCRRCLTMKCPQEALRIEHPHTGKSCWHCPDCGAVCDQIDLRKNKEDDARTVEGRRKFKVLHHPSQ